MGRLPRDLLDVWLGDAAGSANVFFLVLILAFLGPIYLVPLLGVHAPRHAAAAGMVCSP